MGKNKGEKKHILNALDVLIIIVIIGVIAMVAANIVRANPGIVSGGDKEVEYVIQVKDIPSALEGKAVKGDKLYDDETGQLLGEITDVTSKQTELVGYDKNGAPVYTPVEGRIDLYVKLKVNVWVEESGLKIDSYRISVGKEISCHSQNIAISGICISITDIAK